MSAPELPGPGDSHRFTTIGHQDHFLCSPLTEARLDELVRELTKKAKLGPDSLLLDLAGGKGALSIRIAKQSGCHALVVDGNPHFLAEGKQLAEAAGAQSQVEFLHGDIAELETAGKLPSNADLVVCVGARPWPRADSNGDTGSRAGREETLRGLFALAAQAGQVLVGEGYWRHAPDPEFAEFLGDDEDELTVREDTHPTMAKALGFELVHALTSTQAEFDDYDGRFRANLKTWIEAHPTDPEAAAFATRRDAWEAAYLKWGQSSFGFGWYLYSRGQGS